MKSDMVNRIIKQVCEEILLPLGVFQKGTSRTYIDDNGYFLTILEFQPSAYVKGTYLNVALHFLWNGREALSLDFPFGQEVRIKGFVEYQNDEQFTDAVTEYAKEAAAQVLFYRKLQDLSAAKSYAKKWMRKYQGNHHSNELDMFNRLEDREVLQRIKQTRAFWHSKPSMRRMKKDDVYDA